MPARRPTLGARFNLEPLAARREFIFQRAEGNRYTLMIDEAESRYSRNRILIRDTNGLDGIRAGDGDWVTHSNLLIELREAGIWFADIADILGYPSASSASAAYVRECRQRNIEPLVREQNRRVNQQIAEQREARSPEFLNRDHFQGEFDDYTFGVEIEQVGLSRSDLVRITQGLGYPTSEDTSYRHSGYSKWKAVQDGSLRGSTTGELVSRVLRGYDGLVELRDVLLAIKQEGSRINSSCGQHVHIGISESSLRTQGMVIRAHGIFQHVFDLLVNEPRRNHESYARHTSWNTSMHNAWHFQHGRQSEASFSKYQSLNLNHYEEYGTFEFRSLHGSLNPRHTVSWLQLHFDFFAFCEKIARLSSGPLDEVLEFQDSAEVEELWRSMPLTMRYMQGLRETTKLAMYERAANRMQAIGCSQSAIDELYANYRSSFGTRNGKIVCAPWFWETLTGRNAMQNNSLFHLDLNTRQLDDPTYSTLWSTTTNEYLYDRTVSEEGGRTNNLATWALLILQEWACNDNSFVRNETVRKVLREMAVKQFRSVDRETLDNDQTKWVKRHRELRQSNNQPTF